jgi:hypothetical protein
MLHQVVHIIKGNPNKENGGGNFIRLKQDAALLDNWYPTFRRPYVSTRRQKVTPSIVESYPTRTKSLNTPPWKPRALLSFRDQRKTSRHSVAASDDNCARYHDTRLQQVMATAQDITTLGCSKWWQLRNISRHSVAASDDNWARYHDTRLQQVMTTAQVITTLGCSKWWQLRKISRHSVAASDDNCARYHDTRLQ